jgi:large subunit ribosomal protein L9
MQVILKKEVQNIGEAGDLVTVKDGYARNFLIPKNFAEVATEGALKNREQNIARIKAKQEKLHQEALAKAAEIEKLGQIELSAKAGESGKLFGTITTKKLCEELKEKSNIEVDRKTVSLNAPINKIGEYTMLIKLTSKVKTELKIVVTASEVVKESIEETDNSTEEA